MIIERQTISIRVYRGPEMVQKRAAVAKPKQRRRVRKRKRPKPT